MFAKANLQTASLCGAMGLYRSHISVLIYTLSLAPVSPSLRLIVVHSEPKKRQLQRAIWCLLCCQPSQRITGNLLRYSQKAGCSQTRRWRKCEWRSCSGVLPGHGTACLRNMICMSHLKEHNTDFTKFLVYCTG